MKRAILSFSAAAALCAAATGAAAQQSYTYSVTKSRTHTLEIDWRPDEKDYQRYTVSVSPLRLASNGLKVDFESELARPGHWFGTSLVGYFAPARYNAWSYDGYGGNNRASFNSGWDDYHRMWGVGTSAFFKNTFHKRGWYFSTGVTFEFFRVGVMENSFIPFSADGLIFYEEGYRLEEKSYYKPTAQFNFGKHFAITDRCYIDLYAGVGFSYSFYKNDGRHTFSSGYDYVYDGDGYYPRYYSYPRFTDIGGFAYRGAVVTGGFRFGVLLWKERR